MDEIVKLLIDYGIVTANGAVEKKRIVAKVIKDFVNEHNLLIERRVDFALKALASRYPGFYREPGLYSKPPNNPDISKLEIKYIHLRKAILKTAKETQPSSEVQIIYGWNQDITDYNLTSPLSHP